MFEPKITRLNARKKKIGRLLAMLFCTLVIVSTMGNCFGIWNCYAQQELQTQQHTISESLWSNGLPTFGSGNQPSTNFGNIQDHNNAIKSISSSLNFTNSKQLDLKHSFVSNKVIGPDRFRFITSHWTLPDTSLGVDVGLLQIIHF
jgi:hypothetical protein